MRDRTQVSNESESCFSGHPVNSTESFRVRKRGIEPRVRPFVAKGSSEAHPANLSITDACEEMDNAAGRRDDGRTAAVWAYLVI